MASWRIAIERSSDGRRYVVDDTRRGACGRGRSGSADGTAALVAQAPAPAGAAPPGDVVVGSGNYSPIVTDLDQAIEFYGDSAGPHRSSAADAGASSLQHRSGAAQDVRHAGGATALRHRADSGSHCRRGDGRGERARPESRSPAAAGSRRHDLDPDRPRHQRGVRPAQARRRPGRHAGGEPIAFGPGNLARGVIVTDPDGHFVELLQPNPIPETTAPADSNIIGARVRLTVADTGQTMKVYRDLLHIQPQIGDVGRSRCWI